MLEKIGSDQVGKVVFHNQAPLKPLEKCTRRELVDEIFSGRIEKEATPIVTREGNSFKCTYEIKKELSFGKIVGFAEGIPLIGTPIAVICLLGHLIGMGVDKAKEYLATKKWNKLQEGRNEIKEGIEKNEIANAFINPSNDVSEVAKATAQIYNAKLDYAVQARQARASALSIIPFVKPIFRLWQISHAIPEVKPEGKLSKDQNIDYDADL